VNAKSNTEMLLSWDALTVIALQMVVSILTQKMPAFRGITLGTLISGLAWILLMCIPVLACSGCADRRGDRRDHAAAALLRVHLAPRSLWAAGNLYGLCLPAHWDRFARGGWFGGFLIHHFGEVQHRPALIWWAVSGVGVTTAGLLWVYDRLVRRDAAETK